MVRKTSIFLAVLAVLLLRTASGQDNAAGPECLKGTVTKVSESALYLKNTNVPDAPGGKKDVMVILDQATKYFDGTKKVTREALQTDHIVLIYCRMAGKERKADLVRIIGGKKL